MSIGINGFRGIQTQSAFQEFQTKLEAAGVPSDIIAQGSNAVEEYADAHGIMLPTAPQRQEQNQSIFNQQSVGMNEQQGPPAEFASELIAAGVPLSTVQQGKTAVEAYAEKNNITLPEPPEKPQGGQLNQIA